PAGETRTQRFPVSAGEHTLELAATGSAEGVFLWGQPQWIGKARASVPPIVLITMDTTRRDALGPYGGPSGLTPRIDAFARGATVFERAWSTSPWTLPSHASIMTGLYPSRHRAGVDQQHLASEHPTLARLLGEAGYLTAGFAGGALCSHRYGVAQGFGRYLDPETFESSGAELNAAVGELLGEVHHQPLFLFVNFFDPHALYNAPEEFQERAGVEGKRAALAEDPLWQAFDQGDSVAWRRIIDGEGRVTPEILGYVRAAYRSEVAYMDEQIGLLFRQLEEKDLFDRALIILVADHGELLGEYGGLFSHAGRLDPELTEIPMIVKWPGQREGRREDRLVSQVDLFATVLEAAGLEVPSSDGRSLAPREETGAPRILFLEEHESRVHPLPPRLRLAPHVFGVQRPNARLEVWDGGMECARRTPEGWVKEVCSSSPQVVLEHVEQSLGAAPAVQGAGEVDPEAREALKALGYL
ncbi:MAG: sulfatase, partial [Acidobacteria bacterium]|nr:sulfatase [Acidobacteriota bacterium]